MFSGSSLSGIGLNGLLNWWCLEESLIILFCFQASVCGGKKPNLSETWKSCSQKCFLNKELHLPNHWQSKRVETCARWNRKSKTQRQLGRQGIFYLPISTGWARAVYFEPLTFPETTQILPIFFFVLTPCLAKVLLIWKIYGLLLSSLFEVCLIWSLFWVFPTIPRMHIFGVGVVSTWSQC